MKKQLVTIEIAADPVTRRALVVCEGWMLHQLMTAMCVSPSITEAAARLNACKASLRAAVTYLAFLTEAAARAFAHSQRIQRRPLSRTSDKAGDLTPVGCL